MGEEEKGGEGYVWKVHEETRRFAKDLLTENERLRTLVAGLQKEKRDVEESFSALRAEVEHRRREEDALKRQMAEIREENHSFSQKYLEVEVQNSNLANLYVASYRLHGTLDRKEILSSIQEIIINLVGCEEYGIFDLEPGEGMLSLTASMGIDARRYQRIPVNVGKIGETVRSGEIYLSKDKCDADSSEEAPPIACIPLKVEGRVTGVIAIFRLLQHKTELEAIDQEMFDLLATHAAMALYCAGLHARMTTGVKGGVSGRSGGPAGVQDRGRRASVYLHPGQFHVSSEPAAVTTILGSCVAVCLWDPALRFGGINHYLLPYWAEGAAASLRYGNVAVQCLIESLLTLGCVKDRLVAKLFGGASVIQAFQEGGDPLGMKNVQVAQTLLAEAGIRIVGEDVGGRHGRKVIFQTDDGVVWVKSL